MSCFTPNLPLWFLIMVLWDVALCGVCVAELQQFRGAYCLPLQDRNVAIDLQDHTTDHMCSPPTYQTAVSQQMTLIWTLITANTWNLCIINFQLWSRCWQIFWAVVVHHFDRLLTLPWHWVLNSNCCPGWRNYKFELPQNAFVQYGAQRCTTWGMKGHAVHRGWFRNINIVYLFSCTGPTQHTYNIHNGIVLSLSSMLWYYCAIFREFLNKVLKLVTIHYLLTYLLHGAGSFLSSWLACS